MEETEKVEDQENEEKEIPETEKEEKPVEEIQQEETEQDEEKTVEEPAVENPVNVGGFEDVEEDIQTVTIFETPKGPISVVHDVTIGDLIVSTILMAFLIYQVINQSIRSFRNV